ncbi:uncharacterized protein LOC122074565 [Macadamia integrifolia]|uniref:uncharacterized protein LOC122074565 n=1 Tax=Macadamia integrifolia TaxID=60698 RepID=UPI001C4E37E3|nr:uncharacterized protein LOC122074565 [Macadamia integrifolia]
MGRLFLVEIDDNKETIIYTCANCEKENNQGFPSTHIASPDDLQYFGTGPPFWPNTHNHIYSKVINTIMMGEPVRQRLVFGEYKIMMVHCVRCLTKLGSFYIKADSEYESYIVGNFVLHKEAVNEWDHRKQTREK